MQLAVDTSWWTRYRSTKNPDLGARFAQCGPTLSVGQHPAIPGTMTSSVTQQRTARHVQAIANTAGFHFGFIEQRRTACTPTMSQRVISPEV